MKSEETEQPSLSINKQMLEIKKKIQLSEGQRKAAFEDSEAERKTNTEEIQKLKKEIIVLVKELKEKTEATAGVKNLSKRLEAIVGPCDVKNVEEIKHMLDLQIIDKSKALDIIIYKIRKGQKYLTELGQTYHNLISQTAQKEVLEKVDKPNRKATCDLRNNIHAVEIQLREANHISLRYKDIMKSLRKDAARFESNCKKIEEELESQKDDINAVQRVVDEATQKRSVARGHLLREEKLAMAKSNSRDRQLVEGRRLVTKRRQELEYLEKRIFQVAKSQVRPAGNADAPETVNDEEVSEAPTPQEDQLSKAFDILKKATGVIGSHEVFGKFSAQRETLERLLALRMQAEEEKKKLEKKLDDLNAEMEFFKFAEAKESERKSVKMEQIQSEIEEQQNRSREYNALKLVKDKTVKTISVALQELHACINPLAIPGDSILKLVDTINSDLDVVFEKMQLENLGDEEQVVAVEGMEDKWLPGPYSGLVRRTPIPQAGGSPAPPPAGGSDDEDDVPSRTYLKRQAQIVADAKSRRKSIRPVAKKT